MVVVAFRSWDHRSRRSLCWSPVFRDNRRGTTVESHGIHKYACHGERENSPSNFRRRHDGGNAAECTKVCMKKSTPSQIDPKIVGERSTRRTNAIQYRSTGCNRERDDQRIRDIPQSVLELPDFREMLPSSYNGHARSTFDHRTSADTSRLFMCAFLIGAPVAKTNKTKENVRMKTLVNKVNSIAFL